MEASRSSQAVIPDTARVAFPVTPEDRKCLPMRLPPGDPGPARLTSGAGPLTIEIPSPFMTLLPSPAVSLTECPAEAHPGRAQSAPSTPFKERTSMNRYVSPLPGALVLAALFLQTATGAADDFSTTPLEPLTSHALH